MEGRRLNDFVEALQRHNPAGFNATLPTFFEVARTVGLCLDLDSWAQLREDLLLSNFWSPLERTATLLWPTKL